MKLILDCRCQLYAILKVTQATDPQPSQTVREHQQYQQYVFL